MSSDSDAETVLDEDSPLSPCVWTHTAARLVGNQRQSVEQTSALSSEVQVPVSPHRELLLSPASQLNVLSQISELADAQSWKTAARPEASRARQRTHVWASTMETKERQNSHPASTRQKVTRKKTRKQPARSQAERLATDMLDWETCSEGELFAHDIEEDQWRYEDISDSDFEA